VTTAAHATPLRTNATPLQSQCRQRSPSASPARGANGANVTRAAGDRRSKSQYRRLSRPILKDSITIVVLPMAANPTRLERLRNDLPTLHRYLDRLARDGGARADRRRSRRTYAAGAEALGTHARRWPRGIPVRGKRRPGRYVGERPRVLGRGLAQTLPSPQERREWDYSVSRRIPPTRRMPKSAGICVTDSRAQVRAAQHRCCPDGPHESGAVVIATTRLLDA